MLFYSSNFLLFLPVVFLFFSYTRNSCRWIILLASSFIFYAALKEPHLLLVFLIVAVVTFFSAILISKTVSSDRKTLLFWCGVFANISILFYFKYVTFLANNLNALFKVTLIDVAVPQPDLLVSVGISFYVFQAVSYLADIYLEIEPPEFHFGYFALYLGFFPKLLQGPIERAGDLIPQLKAPYVFNYDNARSALLLFAWGMFKKVVVADRLGIIVDNVYNDVHSYTGLSLIAATYLYAVQILCDFSGYTDMALGTARLFNINLTQNFNTPYLATSIADFWRRWHISFSRWILDYIFKPLQMEFRDSKALGTASALLITFTACGLWHGGSWCFIAWGLLHGVYMASSIYYRPLQKNIHRILGLEKSVLLRCWQVFITFNLICFSWIFFRANSMADALYVVTHLFSGIESDLAHITIRAIFSNSVLLGQVRIEFAIALVSIGIMLFVHIIDRRKGLRRLIKESPSWLRWTLYGVFVSFILLFGVYDKLHESYLYMKY